MIVIGYRGNEPSIMNGLFLEQLGFTNNSAQGVYWCVRGPAEPSSLSPLAQQLAAAIGSNFTCVSIDGFDELIDRDLWRMLLASNAIPPAPPTSTGQIPTPLDMRSSRRHEYKELELPLLRARLQQYATRLGMHTPEVIDDAWVRTTGVSLDLLVTHDEVERPTNAGLLLFAEDLTFSFPAARVLVNICGPEKWLRLCLGEDTDLPEPDSNGAHSIEQHIAGNLWSQIDQLTDLLAQFNYSFRLKAEVSKQVQAYSPLALKEMLVNALVHRDYNRDEPIKLTITPHEVSMVSPGGLVPEVQAQTGGAELEDCIKGSRRGIKGYRNPVISDLMYGSGQMDRQGSGLSDMWKTTVSNNGSASFGPSSDNGYFNVHISARPEIVDEITNTAVPTAVETRRYAANMIEFTELPGELWCAPTTVKTLRSLRTKPGGEFLPRGWIDNYTFYTLSNLRECRHDMVLPFDLTEIWTESIGDVLSRPNGHVIVAKLLNELVFAHFKAIGLHVDFGRKRVHFPLLEGENERKITYTGRVKRATRTVVKARMKKDSTTVRYYEHKALTFQVTDFGNCWAIVLSPGYTFTRDGKSHTIGRDRINVLSTRRSARDFNQTVQNDLAFWIAMIAEGINGVFALRSPDDDPVSAYAPTALLSSRPPTVSHAATAFDDNSTFLDSIDADLEELEGEISALIDSEDAFDEESWQSGH